MTGTRFMLVGALAVAITTPMGEEGESQHPINTKPVILIATPAIAEEGGFQTPVNGDGLPIPTGQAGQPSYHTTTDFVIRRSEALR